MMLIILVVIPHSLGVNHSVKRSYNERPWRISQRNILPG